MNNLLLDAATLQAVADTVYHYAERQKAVIDSFLRNVSSLGGEWRDDETFCVLVDEIMKLKSAVHVKMDVVNVYADIFRQRAEAIEQRPKYGGSNGGSFLGTSINTGVNGAATLAQRRQYSSVDKIMQKSKFNTEQLYSDICKADGVGTVDRYLNICTDQTKIDDLEYLGKFLSPATGEPIYPKTIAYRGYGICTPNAQNVCGADFYYKDGTFCGSYTGTSWQSILDLNCSDTSKFRK